MSLANGASQVASVFLFAAIAYLFGATWRTDAFFLALAFSTLVAGPLTSAVATAFIPLLVERKARHPETLGPVVGGAVGWVATVSAGGAVAVTLAAPLLLKLLGEGVGAEARWLTGAYVALLSVLVVTQAVVAVLTAACTADGRYWWPGAAQVLRYGATFGLIVALRPFLGVHSLPASFVLGSVFNVLLLGGSWRGRGVRTVVSLRPPVGFEPSLSLALPIVVGSLALQGGHMVLRMLASGLSVGSVTIFDYANRIGTGVMEFLTSGVLLVALARWSDVVARGDTDALLTKLRQTMLSVLFVIMPAVILLVVLRQPALVLLLERGQFDHWLTLATAAVLAVFVAAIPLDLMSRAYGRLFVAWKDTGILAKLATARMVVTAVAALALVGRLGVTGLALADGIGIVMVLVGAAAHARRRLGPTLRGLGVPLGRLALTSACAALVAWLAAGHAGSSPWSQVVLGTLTACSTYLLVARLLKVPELFSVIELLPWRRPTPQRA